MSPEQDIIAAPIRECFGQGSPHAWVAMRILAALKAEGWVMFRPLDITRIEVIGESVSETWADECFASVDDGGHTLKLFPYGEGLAAQDRRAKSIVSELKKNIAARDAGQRFCDACPWRTSGGEGPCPGRWCEKQPKTREAEQ